MKKSIESSQPEKLVRMKESAIKKPLSKKFRQQLETLNAMPDSQIDFSDAPEMLAGRFKPIKRPIAMQIDADILVWLRSKPGYQTRVNQILREAMGASRK